MAKVNIPIPGQAVRGSKSGRPIMALFDLLGRRWAMGVIWQLNQNELTFREIQARCETISPSVLNQRLKELRAAGLVYKDKHGYALTKSGNELYAYIEPLGSWSKLWATQFK